MKIVVALTSKENELFICQASPDSSKSLPLSYGEPVYIKGKDIYDFVTSKLPLSFTMWTHIDLDTEL